MNENIELIIEWFTTANLKPIKIWGYPASVDPKIFECDTHDKEVMRVVAQNIKDTFAQFAQSLEGNFLMDNKIVLECEILDQNGTTFIGWKDGRWAIGKGVYAYDRQLPKDISHINFHEGTGITEEPTDN